MTDKLDKLVDRYNFLTEEIAKPEVIADNNSWKKLVKEHSTLTPIVETYEEYKKAQSQLADNLEAVGSETDKDMLAMLHEDISVQKKRIAELTEQLKVLLLPKDPNDDKKGIGTGEEYLHQHMVRAYYTSNIGTKIMPEADGTFDYKSLEIALDPSWKKENLKVVLFLHRNATYVNKISCHVYSSKTIPFGGSFSGVTASQIKENSTRLYQDASGLLQIEGDHERVVVYSLEGQCVAESLPAQLPRGSYVVVVSHAQGTTLHKVVVK